MELTEALELVLRHSRDYQLQMEKKAPRYCVDSHIEFTEFDTAINIVEDHWDQLPTGDQQC